MAGTLFGEAEALLRAIGGLLPYANGSVGDISPAPQLIGTPRKGTISAREVDHGQEHARWNAAGRRGATTRVWRSGARPRWQDVTIAQDGGGTAVVSRRRPGTGLALARRIEHSEQMRARDDCCSAGMRSRSVTIVASRRHLGAVVGRDLNEGVEAYGVGEV